MRKRILIKFYIECVSKWKGVKTRTSDKKKKETFMNMMSRNGKTVEEKKK